MNFVPAVAYHFSLNLLGKFSQSRDHFLARPLPNEIWVALLKELVSVGPAMHASIMHGVIDVDSWGTGRQELDKIIIPLHSDCLSVSLRQTLFSSL